MSPESPLPPYYTYILATLRVAPDLPSAWHHPPGDCTAEQIGPTLDGTKWFLGWEEGDGRVTFLETLPRCVRFVTLPRATHGRTLRKRRRPVTGQAKASSTRVDPSGRRIWPLDRDPRRDVMLVRHRRIRNEQQSGH